MGVRIFFCDTLYSLDNLPNEVAYLLQEIKEKEIKVQGTRRLSVTYKRKSTGTHRASRPLPPSPRAPSPKSTLIPGKISTAYAKIDKLSAEKCALAQRIIDLVSRTRTRLDSDVAKVRALRGEPLEPAFAAATTTASGSSARLPRTPSAVGSPMLEGEVYVGASRNPASQIRESLHTALGASTTMPDIQTQPPLCHAYSRLRLRVRCLLQGPARPENRGLGPAWEGSGFHFLRLEPKPWWQFCWSHAWESANLATPSWGQSFLHVRQEESLMFGFRGGRRHGLASCDLYVRNDQWIITDPEPM
ncbi:hypothetical protein B0H14DRAFT_2632282 [Mycena olivaceomarginata]|nr:hypothetical protein B0H14DRAFT_2632282 [Mycena olivaceomarginata]